MRAVKGMHDVLPGETARWRRVEDTFRRLCSEYAFGEIRTPIVEPTELFVRSIGEATDIVEKEMYTFVDKGDESLTLRPEGTAGCVRAYLEHSVYGQDPVTKWFYMGPMYRRERPAKGRYRQFYQLGAEVYGDPGPHVDADVIDLVVALLSELGISGVTAHVNSLGSQPTRERYRAALLDYLAPHRAALCGDCQRRMDVNPLRVLDCKVRADTEIAGAAPAILDHLEADDRAHFDELRRTLDAFGTAYIVDSRIVRGLDYYMRTLFELKGSRDALGAQDTICGGGRYDMLVAVLGGPATPAVGFGAGIERIVLSMPQAAAESALEAFVVAASPGERIAAAALARELRRAGFRTDADLRGQSLKSQLRRADRLGARLALILGANELARQVVQVKDMQQKQQIDVPRTELVAQLRRRLGGET